MIKAGLSRRALMAGASIAAIGGGGAAAALASSSGSAPVFKGCLSRAGTLYNVRLNPRSRPHCRRHDRLVSWNQSSTSGAGGAKGRRSGGDAGG